MKRLQTRTGLLGLLSGTALWILIGASSSLANGAALAGTAPAIPVLKSDPSIIVVAQFHEPRPPSAPPPVIVPQVQPPKVFNPVSVPKPPAKKTNTSTNATAPQPTAEDEAAAEARREAEKKAAAEAAAAAAALKAKVAGLQQQLTDSGFDPGPVDGQMGKHTRSAIEDWVAGLDAEDAASAGTLLANADWTGISRLMSEVAAGQMPETEPLQFAGGSAGAGAGAAGDGGAGASGGGGAGAGSADGLPAEPQLLLIEPDPEMMAMIAKLELGEYREPDLVRQIEDEMAGLDEMGMIEQAASTAAEGGSAVADDIAKKLKRLAESKDYLKHQIAQALSQYESNIKYYKEHLKSTLTAYPKLISEINSIAEGIYADTTLEWKNDIEIWTKSVYYAQLSLDNAAKNGVQDLSSYTREVQSRQKILDKQRSTAHYNELLYSNSTSEYNVNAPTLKKYGISVFFDIDGHLDTSVDYLKTEVMRDLRMLENYAEDLEWLPADIAKFEARRAQVLAEIGGASLVAENEMDALERQAKDIEKIAQSGDVEDVTEQVFEVPTDQVEDDIEPDLVVVPDPIDPDMSNPDPTPDPGGPDNGGPDSVGPDSAGPDSAGGGGAPDPEINTDELADYQAELKDSIDQTQKDIDYFIQSGEQAKAELASLMARTDISAEEKARIRDFITSRIKANEVFAQDARIKLASLGAEYDGYQGKDFTNFNPYAFNETDAELIRISEKAKAAEQFYDELHRARTSIDALAFDDMDAINLNDHVTNIANRVVDDAESYNTLLDMLHRYTDDIRTTRKTGELEYMQAMAESAVDEANADLELAKTVVRAAMNAEIVLMLGGGGYIAVTEGGAAALTFMATTQPVLAGFDASTSAIATYDQTGSASEALREGALQGAKYYLPINTALTLRDPKASKFDIALGVVADAATLFSCYNSLKSQSVKTAAAQAEVTKLTLSPQEQAISKAAKAAAAEGDDLVYAYKTSIEELDALRATGAVDEIAEVEERVRSLVKAIDASDEAKLSLKAKSPELQSQFVTNQKEIIRDPAKALWNERMKAIGWSDEALETASIRNASSAGTAGMDADIRLLQPTLLDEVLGVRIYKGPSDPLFKAAQAEFNAALTKNGQKATLLQWQQDSQAVMSNVMEEVAGHTAEAARVHMTTSADIEAFSDIRLLVGETDAASAAWAEQSASVTGAKIEKGVKAAEAIGLGDSSPRGGLSGDALKDAATEVKVATREVLKDVVGKAQKLRPDVVLPTKIKKQIQTLQWVVDGTTDVAVANKQLVRQTGTSLAKTMDSLGGYLEVMLKAPVK